MGGRCHLEEMCLHLTLLLELYWEWVLQLCWHILSAQKMFPEHTVFHFQLVNNDFHSTGLFQRLCVFSGLSNISLVTVTSFLVGLFSNTLLQRWWALRMHLNGHTGGNNEVIILLSTIMASE